MIGTRGCHIYGCFRHFFQNAQNFRIELRTKSAQHDDFCGKFHLQSQKRKHANKPHARFIKIFEERKIDIFARACDFF